MKHRNLIFQTIVFLLFSAGCSVRSTPASISGRITIAPALASKVGPSDALYVMALPESLPAEPSKAREPAPIAIQKFAPILFPVRYQLSQSDALFPDQRFEGNLTVLARIKRDGVDLSDHRMELEGLFKKNPVPVGTSHVDIVIDQEGKMEEAVPRAPESKSAR